MENHYSPRLDACSFARREDLVHIDLTFPSYTGQIELGTKTTKQKRLTDDRLG